MSILWTIALVIMLGAAYAWGYDNGQNRQPSEQAWLALEMYKQDSFMAYKRWKDERSRSHDIPDA